MLGTVLSDNSFSKTLFAGKPFVKCPICKKDLNPAVTGARYGDGITRYWISLRCENNHGYNRYSEKCPDRLAIERLLPTAHEAWEKYKLRRAQAKEKLKWQRK